MSDYIRYKRLEKCAEDLIRTQPEKRSITDIAYFWGFNNSSSFTRTFKAYFGISPMEYKRR
jgi:AraC-like DNA-binding protein